MRKVILKELLDRYERSRLFREGASSKRILLDVSSCAAFEGISENADRKTAFLSALEGLKQEGLVDYSWVRFERGNLVDKIWLITDPESLKKSYQLLGRMPRAEKVQVLEEQLGAFVAEPNEDAITDIDEPMHGRTISESEKSAGGDSGSVRRNEDIVCFFQDILEEVRSKKKIPRYFFDANGNSRGAVKDGLQSFTDQELNRRLLAFFAELEKIGNDELERVISTKLYGDSKFFEHELRPKVLSILRSVAKQDGREELTDEQLLEERGVFKWPEILEFCGDLSVFLDDGSCIDYGNEVYGAYINSDTVRHAEKVRLAGVSVITSVENKANYTWYIANIKRQEELVLYHGGCFSPVKGRWFRLIADAACDGRIEIRHWSDIDLGGFRIFRRLKEEVFPQLQPWQMDVETLVKYRQYCSVLDSASYRGKLLAAGQDPGYECFQETIRYMLENDVRLEQEAEISGYTGYTSE